MKLVIIKTIQEIIPDSPQYLKGSISKKPPNEKKIVINEHMRTKNNDVLNIFNGWHIFQSNSNPIIAVVPTDILEYTDGDKFKTDFSIKQNMIFALIVIAAGKDFFNILEKIDLDIADVLDSNANKNDGVPTVNALINISCLGLNGSDIPKNIDITIKIAEYIVLTKNKLDVVWILFIARRPSNTASFKDEKLESIRINCEIFLAAELPDATEIEQSDSFKAKISLTPSPIIETLCPFIFIAIIISLFLSGVTRAKIEYLFTAFKMSEYLFKVCTSIDFW